MCDLTKLAKQALLVQATTTRGLATVEQGDFGG